MDLLIFIGLVILVAGVLFGGIYFAKKFKITKEDLVFVELIIDLINILNAKYEWNYSGALDKITTYVIEAMNFVIDNGGETDPVKLRELIFEEAKLICEAEGIEMDEASIDIIGKIVDVVVIKFL